MRHLIMCMRLIDARAGGAREAEISRFVLRIDPASEPDDLEKRSIMSWILPIMCRRYCAVLRHAGSIRPICCKARGLPLSLDIGSQYILKVSWTRNRYSEYSG